MADYFVPSNLFQGRGLAESGGTGSALGDIPILNFLGNPGTDYAPATDARLGGINHQSLGIMASDSDGDSDKEQPAAFREAFLRMGAGAGRAVIAVQGGDPLVIEQCCYAAPMAAGSFFISPSDVGVGPGQVQPDPTTWSREILAPHPAVFVRNPSHCRGIASQLTGSDDAGQMNSGFPSVEVFTVNTAPVYSSWCCVVDGSAMTLIFPHVTAAGPVDLRRPRDIYQQIVMPTLQKAIAQGDPLPLYKAAGGPTLVQRGFVSRMNYVSYSRFQTFDLTVQVTPLFTPS